MFSSLSVYLLATFRKNFQRDLHEIEISGKVGNGPMNKSLNFGGDLDQGSGYGSGYTGKMCLGRGMHCPSAFLLPLCFRVSLVFLHECFTK